jgi:hypothetical protein
MERNKQTSLQRSKALLFPIDEKVNKKSLAKRCCQRALLKFSPPFIRLKF